MGKLKFVFLVGYSILCLEFCGVVLVIEIGEFVLDYFFILMFFIRYFIDSKVVLGYIRNRIRCFYNYVSNRIVCIYVVLIFSQWNYVFIYLNLVDVVIRGLVFDMRNMLDIWFIGLEQFYLKDLVEIGLEVDYLFVSFDEDKDI